MRYFEFYFLICKMEKLEWKMGKSEFSGSSRRGTHKRGFDEARGCHSGCAPTPGFEQAGRQADPTGGERPGAPLMLEQLDAGQAAPLFSSCPLQQSGHPGPPPAGQWLGDIRQILSQGTGWCLTQSWRGCVHPPRQRCPPLSSTSGEGIHLPALLTRETRDGIPSAAYTAMSRELTFLT